MVFANMVWFILGSLVGGSLGALTVVLGVMAKRNVEDVPETPMSVNRDSVPVMLDA